MKTGIIYTRFQVCLNIVGVVPVSVPHYGFKYWPNTQPFSQLDNGK